MRPLTIGTTPRPGIGRLLLFGSGDFACNLYWQGVTLYLLFFYTDVLGLNPAVAGLIYMAGAVWDGIADLLVGIAADRSRRGYRWFVAWGAVPLGLSFPLLFVLPQVEGWPLVAIVLAAQFAFRTLYAVVNVPYAAWSARISDDSRDRTLIAGARLMFGAGAAMLVAYAMPGQGEGHATVAALLALIATPLLVLVARTTREVVVPVAHSTGPGVGRRLSALARNRAFTTLNLAILAAAIAGSVLNQSVLYYFIHVAGQPAAGPAAFASMALTGVVAVPAWTMLTVRIGGRAAWLLAVVIGLAALAAFAAIPARDTWAALPFLVVMQVVLTGLGLAGWAMLPDTVDYGEARLGLRIEATAFGLSALLQKFALGAAAAGLGAIYGWMGYDGSAAQGVVAQDGIRWLMIAGPALALAVSALAMLANPLSRGKHAAIIDELAERRAAATSCRV